VKRSGRDEPVWVVIHMRMKAMLGISLYSYFYHKLEKHYVFLFILHIFSPTKLENKRAEQALPRELGEGGTNDVYTCK
jgi:hypothetical protein